MSGGVGLKLLANPKVVITVVGIVPVHIELAVVVVPVHARHITAGIHFAWLHLYHRKSFLKFPALTD